MRPFRPILPGLAVSLMASTAAFAAPDVVVSIKPVHSLVAGVMEGVGEPTLIVEGAGSPHTYSLKPSKAAAIEGADVVFWMSPELEPFLEKPLESLGANATVVELSETEGLKTMPFRESAAFEAHDHGDEGHDEDDHHDEMAHEDDDHDHDHEEHAAHEEDDHHDHDDHEDEDHGEDDGHEDGDDHDHDHEDEDHHDHDDHGDEDHDEDHHDEDDHEDGDEHDHDHDGHDDHDEDMAEHEDDDHHGDGHGHHHEHGAVDPHLWLDPVNAQVMVAEIAHELGEADPENAERYQANAEALKARLDDLIEQTETAVAPAVGKPFVVFHDAYHYFEDRFGLTAAGSITINPETAPGADQVARIQDKVRDLGATCVFAEPQFEPKLVTVVIEGSDARSGVLDPLGATLEDGPDLYFDLIDNMASSFAECLGPAS